MTPNEINEAVARKLGTIQRQENPLGWTETYPDYCHSIEAAWEIVAQLQSQQMTLALYDSSNNQSYWSFKIIDNKNRSVWEFSADTAPMAICLAFLKLDGPLDK